MRYNTKRSIATVLIPIVGFAPIYLPYLLGLENVSGYFLLIYIPLMFYLCSFTLKAECRQCGTVCDHAMEQSRVRPTNYACFKCKRIFRRFE